MFESVLRLAFYSLGVTDGSAEEMFRQHLKTEEGRKEAARAIERGKQEGLQS